jgi:HEAT repeat protein
MRPAVSALLRALNSGPGDRDTGHGSTGVGIVSVRSAVIEALGRIGDGRAVEPLAAVLATQPAHARVTLEAVVERLERQRPNRTRHVFQDAEVAAALRTLAAIRCETCLPPIIAALQEPWLATAAPATAGRDQSSPSHGPLARESARVALTDSSR